LSRNGKAPSALITVEGSAILFYPPLIATFFIMLSRPNKFKSQMFRWLNDKSRIELATLPTELLLIILDIAIEEDIIRLRYCDHRTFPRILNSISSSAGLHHQWCNSYYRLRLVCRKFNTLLGARPWQSFLDSSSLPSPVTTRVLYLDFVALSKPHIQRLLPGTSAYGRLVHLDVTCRLSQSSDTLNLSQFLCAGRFFSNVQRLTLRLFDSAYSQSKFSFWTPLNRTFPSLVILAVVTTHRRFAIPQKASDDVPCFERLEILYLTREIPYSRCLFPRLRHALVWRCSPLEQETLTGSPYLESLLIKGYIPYHSIDVRSFLRLKLLGFPDHRDIEVVPLSHDHLLEHIWLYSNSRCYRDNFDVFEQLSRLPKVSRITVEFSPCTQLLRLPPIDDLRERKFSSFELSTRTFRFSEPFWVFEREQLASVTGRVLKKARSKIRL
jgi:hypothetical protein